MYTYSAKNQNTQETCGHDHRSYEAARKCLPRLRAKNTVAGAAITVVSYHGADSNGERGTQTNYQGR